MSGQDRCPETLADGACSDGEPAAELLAPKDAAGAQHERAEPDLCTYIEAPPSSVLVSLEKCTGQVVMYKSLPRRVVSFYKTLVCLDGFWCCGWPHACNVTGPPFPLVEVVPEAEVNSRFVVELQRRYKAALRGPLWTAELSAAIEAENAAELLTEVNQAVLQLPVVLIKYAGSQALIVVLLAIRSVCSVKSPSERGFPCSDGVSRAGEAYADFLLLASAHKRTVVGHLQHLFPFVTVFAENGHVKAKFVVDVAAAGAADLAM